MNEDKSWEILISFQAGKLNLKDKVVGEFTLVEQLGLLEVLRHGILKNFEEAQKQLNNGK